MDETLAALRQAIDALAEGTAKPGIRFLVYPPEWEAPMQARLVTFTDTYAAAGRPVELVDLGRSLVEAIDARPGTAEGLANEEALGTPSRSSSGPVGRLSKMRVVGAWQLHVGGHEVQSPGLHRSAGQTGGFHVQGEKAVRAMPEFEALPMPDR